MHDTTVGGISVLDNRFLHNRGSDFEFVTWILFDSMLDTCPNQLCFSHINAYKSTHTFESGLHNRYKNDH